MDMSHIRRDRLSILDRGLRGIAHKMSQSETQLISGRIVEIRLIFEMHVNFSL